MNKTRWVVARAVARWLTACSIVCCCGLAWGLDFPGRDPGRAVGRIDPGTLTLENEALALTWNTARGALSPGKAVDKLSGSTLDLASGECFRLVLGDSPSPQRCTYGSAGLKIAGKPALVELTPKAGSPRRAEQLGGKRLVVDLAAADGSLDVQWQATLRDGSNYVQQTLLVKAKGNPRELIEIVPIELAAPNAAVMGTVDGSPVVAGNWFFACEHPMSKSQVLDPSGKSAPGSSRPSGVQRFSCTLTYNRTLHLRRPIECSSVIGVVPPGQLRRGFLYYLERERAHPYRPFLHYNNGSEIGCRYWQRQLRGAPGEGEKFRLRQEAVWIKNIEAFGRELVEARQVPMDSFAHDFEWDDENLVWQFHKGYPQGFAPARKAAEKYGSHLGVWLSPFGGYPCKPGRIKSGTQQGFEINRNGLSLAGPRYYARFRAACTNMIRQYGVNYFKFDGFGAGNSQPGAGPFATDVDALLRLIEELRTLDPHVFINPSTGSWPSPFWLRYADAIWRQGADTNLTGKGSQRQKWITYRDGEICHGTLERGPLYPANSLMIHGVFVNALPLSGNPYDPATPRPTYDPAEIVQEIRSFFGTGTNLQELYVEPGLMTAETWNALAEAALWSRRNADVLVDTHHIGGDPAKSEVYGWASWSKRQGILVLRNPDDRPAQIALDIGKAFELPAGAATQYALSSPWKADAGRPAIQVAAGREHSFSLKSFEVLVFDAQPSQPQ